MRLILAFLLLSNLSFSQELKAKFTNKNTSTVEVGYVLKLPENQKNKFPLIVFLHGSGERGTDLELVKNHSPFTYQNLISEPAAILAPQCPENVWWDIQAIYMLIQNILTKYNVDASRVYLTGLSMGGWGTWKLAEEHPELFAAVAPVCGPVDRLMILNADKLKDMPIKIYHGALDDVVQPSDSIDIYQELKKTNKGAEIIIFSEDNHNSWDSTYSNPKFYEWLLAQHK